MQLEAESRRARGREDSSGLVDGEDAGLAEDVGEAGEPCSTTTGSIFLIRRSTYSARRASLDRYSSGISCAPSQVGTMRNGMRVGEAADDARAS